MACAMTSTTSGADSTDNPASRVVPDAGSIHSKSPAVIPSLPPPILRRHVDGMRAPKTLFGQRYPHFTCTRPPPAGTITFSRDGHWRIWVDGGRSDERQQVRIACPAPSGLPRVLRPGSPCIAPAPESTARRHLAHHRRLQPQTAGWGSSARLRTALVRRLFKTEV